MTHNPFRPIPYEMPAQYQGFDQPTPQRTGQQNFPPNDNTNPNVGGYYQTYQAPNTNIPNQKQLLMVFLVRPVDHPLRMA